MSTLEAQEPVSENTPENVCAGLTTRSKRHADSAAGNLIKKRRGSLQDLTSGPSGHGKINMEEEKGPSIFHQPVCLIESDGSLTANPEALKQLEKIENSLNIVAIAGIYRQGKSYLMNRLAGTSKGFPLGSGIQAKTKGIWIWCRPHPVHKDQVLVLLDTEGLGDVEKGDQNHDNWIFALATLLSSTLVYNTLGAIDQNAIEKLNFVTEISKHIKTKDSENISQDYDLYFPAFIVTLRDFSLDLEVDQREITADEYLDHCLTLKEEVDEITKKFNEPRRCIRRYFTSRKCFTFDRPGNKKTLKELETLTDDDLEEDFVNSVTSFCNHVYKNCEHKKLDTGVPVTGRMFVTLVKTYVESIRSGAVPCIENALNAMAMLENTKAVEESFHLYCKLMSENVKLPTETDGVLTEVHHRSVQEVVKHFLKKAIYDDDHVYQKRMNKRLEEEYAQIKERNESESERVCRELLNSLNDVIDKKLKDGAYLCNGGYALYQNDLHAVQAEYSSTQGLGVKANDSLIAFLNEKWIEGQSILAADQKVSADEKKIQAEKQKKREAEREMEAAKREAMLKEQHAKDTERMMKENMAQLEKRREEELANLTKHHEQVIESRLAEQKRTLDEGFKKEADKMKAEIQTLKNTRPRRGRRGCFADTSLVRIRTKSGQVVTTCLSELQVGDAVESFNFQTNKVVFSDVYFITHSSEGNTYGSEMVFLKSGNDDNSDVEDGIRLDENHLIYASKPEDKWTIPPQFPVRASEVKVGDIIWVKSPEGLAPKPVTEVRRVRAGIRHPMTMNHVIIVDNVLASVHMYHERLYRALTSPLRLMYRFSPSAVQSGFVTGVINAWDYVENLL